MSMSNVSLPILGSPKSHTKKTWISTSSWEQNLKKWFVLQSSNVFSLHKGYKQQAHQTEETIPRQKFLQKFPVGPQP